MFHRHGPCGNADDGRAGWYNSDHDSTSAYHGGLSNLPQRPSYGGNGDVSIGANLRAA